MIVRKHIRSKSIDEASSKDLWINPRANLRGPDGSRAWNVKGNLAPDSGAKFLELADIALGLKKPAPKKKKAAAAGIHTTSEKTEPYTAE